MAHPIPTRPQTFLHPLVHPLLLHRAAKPVVWCLCLAPLAWLVVALFTQQLGANPAEALLRSTGDWALRGLCLALAITPLRQALGLPALARMRRLIGLFAFFYAAIHALCYLWLDMGWQWALALDDVLQRPFILVGALALLVLLALALTSPQRVLQALGARRWQRLHIPGGGGASFPPSPTVPCFPEPPDCPFRLRSIRSLPTVPHWERSAGLWSGRLLRRLFRA